MRLTHTFLLSALLLPQSPRVALATDQGERTGREWLLASELERLQWIDGLTTRVVSLNRLKGELSRSLSAYPRFSDSWRL